MLYSQASPPWVYPMQTNGSGYFPNGGGSSGRVYHSNRLSFSCWRGMSGLGVVVMVLGSSLQAIYLRSSLLLADGRGMFRSSTGWVFRITARN